MLQSEFENLTGIYPDSVLYEEIEQEYMNGDWKGKQGFCHDYKFNVNGLAEKIQRRANERIWKQEDKHRRTADESSKRIMDLFARCERLEVNRAELIKELERRSDALILSSMTKTGMVWALLSITNGNIQRLCSTIAEGYTSEDNLKQLQKFIEQRTELKTVLSELQDE